MEEKVFLTKCNMHLPAWASCCHHQSDYFDLKTFFIRALFSTSSNKRKNWKLWIPFYLREMLVIITQKGMCGAKVVVGLIGTNVGHEELTCFELKTVNLSPTHIQPQKEAAN